MQWEFQRDMALPRSNLMCGLVHNEAGEQEVVAAGGYGFTSDPGSNPDATEVEIFNVRSGQWRSGKTKSASSFGILEPLPLGSS